MSEQLRVRAVLMRGGTSKGVFFHAEDLPADPLERDRVLLRALGSPDPYGRQIDGVGGATSSTSKAVLISRSTRPDCDVDYLFAQVSIDRAVIDYSGNCGNLTAAVGPFAIEEGLVPARDGTTTVRVWQANTGKRILAHCPTPGGVPAVDGDFVVDGIPWPGAEVVLEFQEPGATACDAVLPTGAAVDLLDVPGDGAFEVSLVDAGIPLVVLAAASLGLGGDELPETLNRDAALLDRLESIRRCGAVAMRLGGSAEEVGRLRQASPKIALVAAPAAFVTTRGIAVEADGVDVLARIVSMERVHHAAPVTATVALATAAAIPGTVVHRLLRPGREPDGPLRIGHPAGRSSVRATLTRREGEWAVTGASLGRTARRLMEGHVRVPASTVARRTVAPTAAVG